MRAVPADSAEGTCDTLIEGLPSFNSNQTLIALCAATGRQSFALNPAHISNSSAFKTTFIDTMWTAGTAPVGNRRQLIWFNDSGTTNDPYLSITTVTSTNYTLTASGGTFTLTGTAAGLKAARKIAANSGAFTLMGTAAGIKASRRFTADSGTFALSGQAIGFYRGKRLIAESGAFSLSGQAVQLRKGVRLTAGAGAFTLTGGYAGLAIGRRLSAETGVFTLTGSPVVMVSTNWTFTPDTAPPEWATGQPNHTDWTTTRDAAPGSWAA